MRSGSSTLQRFTYVTIFIPFTFDIPCPSTLGAVVPMPPQPSFPFPPVSLLTLPDFPTYQRSSKAFTFFFASNYSLLSQPFRMLYGPQLRIDGQNRGQVISSKLMTAVFVSGGHFTPIYLAPCGNSSNSLAEHYYFDFYM